MNIWHRAAVGLAGSCWATLLFFRFSFLIPCDLIERERERDMFVGTFPLRMRLFSWCLPTAGLDLGKPGTSSCPQAAQPRPGQHHLGSRDRATKLSSKWELSERPGLVLTRPPQVPNPGPSPGSGLSGWHGGCSSLRRDGLMPWVLLGCGSTRPSARHLFCRLSACFCSPLSSRLLFSPSRNLISQGKAGHEFQEQLLFCNRSLARTAVGIRAPFVRFLAQSALQVD